MKFLIIIFVLLPIVSNAQYIQTANGDIPILVTVDHDGNMTCGSLPHPMGTWYQSDTNLRGYVDYLVGQIKAKIGNPYFVRLNCNKKWVDGNRYPESGYAYDPNNIQARNAFYDYHDAIDDAIADMENRWGNNPGIAINIHTQRATNEAMVGYDQKKNSWGNIYTTALSLYRRNGISALMDIADSIGTVSEVTTESANGQGTVSLHGTNEQISHNNYDSPWYKNPRWAKTIDFIQLEHPAYLIGNISSFGKSLAEAEVNALKNMLAKYYKSPLANPCDKFVPGRDWCKDCGPCAEGEGDCDGDIECLPGLICAQDVGLDYGWPWSRDVCEKPAGTCQEVCVGYEVICD